MAICEDLSCRHPSEQGSLGRQCGCYRAFDVLSGDNQEQQKLEGGKRGRLLTEGGPMIPGGDGGELNSPSRRRTSKVYYRLSQLFDVTRWTPTDGIPSGQPVVFGDPYRRSGPPHSD